MANDIPVFTASEFARLAAAEPDVLASHPCVVEDFIRDWPGYAKWTDLDYLASTFGHIKVEACAPQFVTRTNATLCRVVTTFDRYMEYLRDPASARTLFDGAWREGDYQTFAQQGLPLYCGSLRFIKRADDPMMDDFRPLLPGSLECWNDQIPYYYELHNHFWLYVSRAGALTPLHVDNNAVSAYLAQLKGVKKAILYDPKDRRYFYNSEVGYLDPHNPDEHAFPEWRSAEPWMATLKRGQMLLFGSGWAHHVVTLEDSITVSLDVVNQSNAREFVHALGWLSELGRLVKSNPRVIRSLLQGDQTESNVAAQSDWIVGREMMIRLLGKTAPATPDPRARAIKNTLLELVEALDVRACA